MGKNKGNRTKNNARPSSSSHCAELLGASIPTFFGLPAVKDGTAPVQDVLAGGVDFNIDSNFQIVLKKMNKKDATTKLKALQEFTELCRNSEADAVKEVLPFWPRLYTMLCTDVENKVREAAHIAHKVVISRVKRSIAPYLKQLAGPWFTSQYDSYPPAAKAATLAFEEAFSPSKLNEAIMFCQEEILNYVHDNLIKHTSQTLSNPKTTSPEQMEAKYQRVVISSLLGFSLYLQRLTPEQIQQSEETAKKIISSPKFWKYSKHEAPLIQNSFYVVLIALCQHANFLLKGEAARVVSAVFCNLDQSDAVVLPTVWDAALNVLVVIEDCLTQVNLEKQVFPKLNVILKEGGRGNASKIFPNILPLLSKLPSDLIKDKKLFYINFFDNMRTGLEFNSVIQSRSEGKIVAITFVECLQYIIMCNSKDEDLCKELVSRHLVQALEIKLTLSKAFSQCATVPLIFQTACLLRYWHRNRLVEEHQYQPLLDLTWESLWKIFEKIITGTGSEEVLTYLLKNQVEFILIFQNPNKYLAKTKGKVKFEDERTVESDDSEKDTLKKVEEDDPEFMRDLLLFVRKVVSLYLKNTLENHTNVYLPHINKIVANFDSKVIFQELAVLQQSSNIFTLFTSLFSKWLTNPEMRVTEVVDLSFSLLPHVSREEKEFILTTLTDNWSNDSLQLDVCRAVLRFSNDDCVKSWVRSSQFTKSIVELTEKFVNGNKDDNTFREIIHMIFEAKCDNDELLINADTADSVVNIIHENMRESGSKAHVNSLGEDLVALQASCSRPCENSYKSLVCALFKRSCLADDENVKLINACETGLLTIVELLGKAELKDFTNRLSVVVKETIFSDKTETDLKKIIAKIKNYMELVMEENAGWNNYVFISSIFLENPPEIVLCRNALERCCRVGYCGKEDFDTSFLEIEKSLATSSGKVEYSFWLSQYQFQCHSEANNIEGLDTKMITDYAKWTLFSGNLLHSVMSSFPRSYTSFVSLKKLIDYDSESDIEQTVINTIDEILKEATDDERHIAILVCKHLFDFTFSTALLNSFCVYYACTKYYNILQEPLCTLKALSTNILESCDVLEKLFSQHTIKYYVINDSRWRMVLPSIKDILRPIDFKELGVISLDYIENFIGDKIRSRTIGVNLLLELSSIIQNRSQVITDDQWQVIFIYLDACFDELSSKSNFEEVDMFCLSATARLFLQLKKCFRENHLRPLDDRVPPESFQAYNEVVEPEIFGKFFAIWMLLAEKWHVQDIRTEYYVVLENVNEVIVSNLSLLKHDDIHKCLELVTDCGRFITSRHSALQITAFRILMSYAADLVKMDTETFQKNISQMPAETREGLFKEVSDCDWACKNLENVIIQTQSIVETLLSDFVIGDCCTVEPFTDSYSYTYSYLLLWSFILEMCGEAHSPLRYQYAGWLRDRGYSNCLLESVFKLMPQTVLHSSEAKENCQKYFESYSYQESGEPVQSCRIEQTACFVYRMFLQRLPNVIREWWSQSENKISTLVDRVTSLYVSPILISIELKNVLQDRDFDKMEVKTYITSREIIATYCIDEVKMDLVMTLPTNHPLGTIKIESGNVVVGTANWRSWLFHISKYLIHQNGTVWDALVIWKNNLDKKFEGVEECYICFSILHGSSLETPRLSCQTCKKKFHSNCLYTWFNTSNKSTCPICRNLF